MENKKMSLTQFCMEHMKNDSSLSKILEDQPLLAMGFIMFGVYILNKYQEALIEGIEFKVKMEDE